MVNVFILNVKDFNEQTRKKSRPYLHKPKYNKNGLLKVQRMAEKELFGGELLF